MHFHGDGYARKTLSAQGGDLRKCEAAEKRALESRAGDHTGPCRRHEDFQLFQISPWLQQGDPVREVGVGIQSTAGI